MTESVSNFPSRRGPTKMNKGFFPKNDPYRRIGIKVYQLLFDAQKNPTDCLLLDVNPASGEIFGQGKSQIIGKQTEDTICITKPEWFIRCVEVVKNGQARRFEVFDKARCSWFDMIIMPLEKPDKFGILLNDITPIKKIRDEFVETKRRYEELVDFSPVGICEIDLCTGKFVSVNNALCTLSGYSKEELIRMPPFDLLDEESARRLRQRYPQGLMEETGYSSIELCIRNKGGYCVDVNSQGYFLRDEKGELTRLISMGMDVSPIKKAKNALLESEERLTFLLKLSDILRSISDPDELLGAVMRLVKNDFEADRCWYSEIKDEKAILRRDSDKGELPPIPGVFPPNPPAIQKLLLRAGQPLVVYDVRTSSLVDEELRQLCKQLQIVSYIGIPVVRVGKAIGLLYIAQSTPRIWTNREMQLAIEVADRTRRAVKRAQTERALQESEAKYRRLYETSNDGFLWFDRDGHITEVNEGTDEISGFVREELVGKRWIDFIDDEWVAEALKFWDISKSGKSIRTETKLKKKDGSRFWARTSTSPCMDEKNQYAGCLVAFSDITEQKEAEIALRKSERKYQKLFEASNDGFWWMDKDGYMVEVSAGTIKAFGYDKEEELIGRHWYHLAEDRWLDKVAQEWENRKAGKSNRYETQVKRKDGSLLWIAINGSPLMDEDGRFAGSLAAFKDITAQKIAEERLIQSEKRALALVTKLERADANKDKFIGILSHELRNPLATVTGAVELLELTNKSENNLETIEILKRQTGQLTELVNELLNITRITQNRMVLNRERVILNPIVRDAVADLKVRFEEKGLKLRENLCEQLIAVNGDSLRIAQCIGNVLANALKFTQAGGTVIVSLKMERKAAIITIKDNGAGISPEMLSTVFEPFQQFSDSQTNQHEKGLGLGLSIAKSIIEMHGGNISAKSPGLGGGSSFALRLPVCPGEESD